MSKRELIEPTEGDKRYVRRDDQGQFSEQETTAASRAPPISDSMRKPQPSPAKATKATIRRVEAGRSAGL